MNFNMVKIIFLLSLICGLSYCVNVDHLRTLTVRIEEDVSAKNCNSSLESLQAILTATSLNIYNLTNGIVALDTVNILLPSSWHTSSCTPAGSILSSYVHDEDVKIIASHPVLGDNPWTVQYGGCQQSGKNIELPLGFLGKNSTMDSKSSTLAKEWIKLSFGVFEETGFEGDNIYPGSFVEGRDNKSNNGCLSKHQVHGICNVTDSYNEDLPTKQNILCNRQSIKSILNSGLELEQSSLSPTTNISAKIRDPASFSVGLTFAPPKFVYQVPARKRFIIVLDRSQGMGLNNRWSLLHGQLFRFISSLPNDVEVGIVTFGPSAEMVLTPTLLTSDNREGVYGRVPRRVLDDEDVCLECAIHLAIKTLKLGGRTSGGSIVLVTAAKSRPSEFDEMVQSLQASQHQLHMITFEDSTFYDARHLSGARGKMFVVHETNHDVLASALNISDIFTSVLRQSADVDIMKFHHDLKITDNSNTVSGNFIVEESLRKNLWIEINSPEQDDIEYFELTNPTGEIFQFPKFEHELVYFKLSGLQEPGIWSYKAKLYKKIQLARVSVQAMGEPSNEDWAVMESWTSVDHHGVNALTTPVMIYARLTRHNSPVVNASVLATVHRPGADPVTIVLRDTGSGYPDITQGDGIYSAYFTQFTSEPGFYSVVVTASNKLGQASLPRMTDQESTKVTCCGSSMPFSFTVPTTPFTRHDLAGSFFVQEGSQFYLRQGSPHRNDVYPPSRITDFQLYNYLDNSLYVTLVWTAPGNDYDYGKAFRYEIRCYTNKEALREENFTDMGILVHTSLIPVPEEYGTEQRSTVGIPWPNEVFYYAIVAYDEEGNRGQVSNVVSVFAVEKPPTPTPAVGFDGSILDNELYPLHESQPLTATNSDTLIYIVSGVISALLVVILLVVVSTLLRSRCHANIKQSSSSQIYVKESFESSLGGTLKKVASLPDVTKDNVVDDSKQSAAVDNESVESIDKSDNLSWRYLTSQHSPNKARGQEVAGIHRIHSTLHSTSYQPPSTDSSMYSSNDSETTASAEFVLGPSLDSGLSLACPTMPRISIMEDYTVYRDLSHLDSITQEYFSISQLPKELQGLSVAPYSPGFDTMESHKRRHISLV